MASTIQALEAGGDFRSLLQWPTAQAVPICLWPIPNYIKPCVGICIRQQQARPEEETTSQEDLLGQHVCDCRSLHQKRCDCIACTKSANSCIALTSNNQHRPRWRCPGSESTDWMTDWSFPSSQEIVPEPATDTDRSFAGLVRGEE